MGESVDIETVVTAGLGDNSYVVSSEGEAAVIDPQRDVRRLLEPAERRGVAVRHILETHVHNDYLSGALEIKRATGAEIAAPAKGGYGFTHRPMAEGDEVAVGDVRLVAMETPGHTPEHLSYVLYEGGGDEPLAVFTGGSLMVGGAGRTDLLGTDRAEELARRQYRSLRRLGELPGDVAVLPTHGAGSFCGAGPAPKSRTSTIEAERRDNRALLAQDEESFVRQQLAGLLAYPTYYANMAPINRGGPTVLGEPLSPAALGADELAALLDRSVRLVDARPRRDFAEAHVPGSINVELADDFGSYVGWLLPFNEQLALILPEPAAGSAREAGLQLFRIGYERLLGYLDGGVDAWRAAGRPVRSYPVADVDDLCRAYRSGRPPEVLDVRQQVEWDRGRIPGSRHVFVGDLPSRVADLPAGREVWTICATGHRSSIAASLLDAAEVPVRLVGRGGVEDWLRDCPPGPDP